MNNYLTAPRASKEMPKGIPYIIGNEAAERFSFYGMKGILVVFMTKYLHILTDNPNLAAMSKAASIEQYHNFTSWVYLTPILGALLADTMLGKYRTIISLSLVYCLGHLALAFMGTGGLTPESWMMTGLALISLGSGGIKLFPRKPEVYQLSELANFTLDNYTLVNEFINLDLSSIRCPLIEF